MILHDANISCQIKSDGYIIGIAPAESHVVLGCSLLYDEEVKFTRHSVLKP